MSSPRHLVNPTPTDETPAAKTNRFNLSMADVAKHKTLIYATLAVGAAAVAGFKAYSMFSGSKSGVAADLKQAVIPSMKFRS